jgi:hypothetical protein
MTQISDMVKAATIIGVAIIFAGVLVGGFYDVVPAANGVYRVNKFTGNATLIAGIIELPVFTGDEKTSPTPASTSSK